MLFVTFQYALFLLGVLAVVRILGRRRTAANRVLLAASLVFYTLWIPAYLPLLLADIAVNYALLRGISGSARGSARQRVYLFASIVFTLSLLLYFKYAAFLVENAAPVLRHLSPELPFSPPEILLPLGISFYTFQIISLAVDTSRPGAPPVRGFGQYALYIAFFPQLIAGPILRGGELLPQLRAGPRPTVERTRRGLWLIGLGLFKKVVLADFLLAPFVDAVFEGAGVGSASFHWIAMYSFSFQIYFDFSGYTDMARGSALLIGFELPENFREPYLARSPQEFWQRWHITLSRWLGLYLFTPVSRSLMRRAGARWDRQMLAAAHLVTMTLCGLWHGAGWNFVLWGALQGVLLIAWRRPRAFERTDVVRWSDAPSILLFYNLFCLTLVLFRAPDLSSAGAFFHGLFAGSDLTGMPRLATLAVFACALFHLGERWARAHVPALQQWCATRPAAAYLEATALGLLAGVAIMVAGAGGEFIYFQF